MEKKTHFTLIELLVNAACKTGVLYNRCGMLSLWGGALKTDKNGQKRTKTDIGAPQNTAGFAQQQNTPLFLKEKSSCAKAMEENGNRKRKLRCRRSAFSREKKFSPSPISQRFSNKKKDAEAAVPGRNFGAASAGVWGNVSNHF